MDKNKLLAGKRPAQAMVEFAIALPILLLLLYGILEAGRFIFIYSSVVTASRQAVRYGSATGEGTNTGIPRYQDCAGIREAANRADYLDAFDPEDVTIEWDTGPGTTATLICDGSPLPATHAWTPSGGNTSRLNVTIEGDFNPVVPKIVPFIARTAANGNPVRGVSARTILVSVEIVVTVPPSTWIAPTSTPTETATPTATSTPTSTPTVTPTLQFTETPSLTPSITITPSRTVTPTTSVTPTLTLTNVPYCATIKGPLSLSGNTMILTIDNPYPWPLTTGEGIVTWNHDKGHKTGTDKTLNLSRITIAGTTVWSGNPNPSLGPSQTFTNPAVIPANSSTTFVFTFHQEYDNWDNPKTEYVSVLVTTPGCTNVYIQSQ